MTQLKVDIVSDVIISSVPAGDADSADLNSEISRTVCMCLWF